MGDPKSVDPAASVSVDSPPPRSLASPSRSIDPAAIEMLQHAEGCGADTAFTRAEQMKPCPIGESGACCRICSMGPCRLLGKDADDKTGVCGADRSTIAARHFARQVAGGVAAHSDHGRDMAHTLLAAASGAAPDYVIKDEQKLIAVAGYLGVATAGRSVNDIAARGRRGQRSLQFGQQHGEIVTTRARHAQAAGPLEEARPHPASYRPRGHRGHAPHP